MNKAYKTVRKFGVAIFGFTVITFGVALLVLPGPGILVIILGLAILSLEFEWAERYMYKLRSKVRRTIKSKKQR